MLALDHIGKTYPNGVRALDGVTLRVAPGEIVAIVDRYFGSGAALHLGIGEEPGLVRRLITRAALKRAA